MLTPRAYQLEAIARGTRSNYLLADECGLGKTLTAIETVKAITAEHNAPALIIIPKSLRQQWYNALVAQGVSADRIVILDSSASRLEAVVELTSSDRPFQYPAIILSHYEAVVKHHTSLQRLQYSVIICDEAHRIKNRKAQRTQAIKGLRAWRKIALTGTPFDRNPADAWSILNWLEPAFFRSYWRFFEAHVSYTATPLGNGTVAKTPKGIADVERFTRVLRQYSMRRLKTDVREDLPAKIETYIPITMGPAQQRIYTKLCDTPDYDIKIDDVSIPMPIVLTQILQRIKATTDPTLLGLKAPSAKLEWVQEWVEDNDTESVIIFTRFRETAIKLHELLGGVLIVGGTQRPNVTPANRLIIGTTAAMGEGLDLPWIDNAIFVDCEYSSILMTQAIDRIHRISITSAKHIMYLVCEGTDDELVYGAVRDKLTMAEMVTRFLRGENHKL